MGRSMEVHYLHSSMIFPAINLHLVRGISQPRLFTGGYVQLLSHYYSKWTIPQPYWEIQISEMGLQTGYPMIISYLYLYISIYIWLVVSNMFFFHNKWDSPSHWLIFFRAVGQPPTNIYIYIHILIHILYIYTYVLIYIYIIYIYIIYIYISIYHVPMSSRGLQSSPKLSYLRRHLQTVRSWPLVSVSCRCRWHGSHGDLNFRPFFKAFFGLFLRHRWRENHQNPK